MTDTKARDRFTVIENGMPMTYANAPIWGTSVIVESNGAKVEFCPADLPSQIINAALFKVLSDKVLDAASGALAACIKAKHGDTELSADQREDFKASHAASITEQAQIMLDKAVRALMEGTAVFKGQTRDKAAADPLADLAKWLDDNRPAVLRAYIPTIGTVKKVADRLPVIKAWLESDDVARDEMAVEMAEETAKAQAAVERIKAKRDAILAAAMNT